jgi:hypothetical protein
VPNRASLDVTIVVVPWLTTELCVAKPAPLGLSTTLESEIRRLGSTGPPSWQAEEADSVSTGWQLRARWHRARLDAFAINEFVHDRRARVWQRSCGTCWPCAVTHGREEGRTGVMQDTQVKDAVDQVRSATQQLHKAISDAAAKRGGAVKADLQAVPQMAKAAIDSIKGSMANQNDIAKKRLAEAVTYLEATGKHAADGVRRSGKEFQTAVRQTIADARGAAQKVSEAVAANRTAGSAQSARK